MSKTPINTDQSPQKIVKTPSSTDTKAKKMCKAIGVDYKEMLDECEYMNIAKTTTDTETKLREWCKEMGCDYDKMMEGEKRIKKSCEKRAEEAEKSNEVRRSKDYIKQRKQWIKRRLKDRYFTTIYKMGDCNNCINNFMIQLAEHCKTNPKFTNPSSSVQDFVKVIETALAQEYDNLVGH